MREGYGSRFVCELTYVVGRDKSYYAESAIGY